MTPELLHELREKAHKAHVSSNAHGDVPLTCEACALLALTDYIGILESHLQFLDETLQRWKQ